MNASHALHNSQPEGSSELSARDGSWHERLRRAALRQERAPFKRVIPRRVVHVLTAAGR